mmetsp:Transcript_3553/g.9861  ORF Transcript_3553/g.9861 Transcript_3553/m.9861 type:complete len:127 (+) Transcript_3553:3450-3830(+)
MTALHYAASKGRLECVKLLCESGARVNAKDKFGYTVAMRAAAKGHTAVLRELIERGADLRKVNAEEDSALHAACEADTPDAAALLLALPIVGPELRRTPNKAGALPLDLATQDMRAKLRDIRPAEV